MSNRRKRNMERYEREFRFRYFRFLVYLINDFISPYGFIFIFFCAFSAPMAFIAIHTTIYKFFTVILSITVLCFFFNFYYRPQVKCSRILPDLVEAKTDQSYKIILENISRKKIFNPRVREIIWTVYLNYKKDHNSSDIILPGETITNEVTVSFSKRGVYKSKGIRVSSNYPYNLFNWRRAYIQKASVIVFPSYQRLETFDLPMIRKFQPGGISLTSNVGDSTEFFGTREYSYGDNPRHIHWKSWAKLGKPVIKEFQEEYFVRLAMILDTQTKNHNEFEESLSFATSIADFLSRKDYIIDIFATGNEIYHFQSGRALAHFENILELMACLEPSKKVEF